MHVGASHALPDAGSILAGVGHGPRVSMHGSFEACKERGSNFCANVQGESSTGVHQNMAGLGELCHSNGTLLLVDTVCTLGGVPMFADDWGIDAIYSARRRSWARRQARSLLPPLLYILSPPWPPSLCMGHRLCAAPPGSVLPLQVQGCSSASGLWPCLLAASLQLCKSFVPGHDRLSASRTACGSVYAEGLFWRRPGAAPLFFSQRALEKLRGRKTKVGSYMLDLNLIGDYWGWYGSRFYHHTGLVSLWCALFHVAALLL